MRKERWVLLTWKEVMSGRLIGPQQNHWSAGPASVYSWYELPSCARSTDFLNSEWRKLFRGYTVKQFKCRGPRMHRHADKQGLLSQRFPSPEKNIGAGLNSTEVIQLSAPCRSNKSFLISLLNLRFSPLPWLLLLWSGRMLVDQSSTMSSRGCPNERTHPWIAWERDREEQIRRNEKSPKKTPPTNSTRLWESTNQEVFPSGLFFCCFWGPKVGGICDSNIFEKTRICL